MSQQLNVSLAFTADTEQAKQQLEGLQNFITKLKTSAAQKSPLGITNEINTAISDVSKLEVALKKATTATGTLDLGQFKQELNQAGLSASKIATQLTTLGPAGAKAFSQLAQSVMTAEIPLKQTSALLTEFKNVLARTARWQISSSILHGFIGSIHTAYSYAQNLNKSLNNIRIVTGYSADEMANFAKEANEAAQALSTTTTEYTNASLIYYQQGLDDEAVKERTDATVKMANVTRESAQEVSQQMTAIWNNFDDGSKSLEYYSDVITALGAATASSSAEISEGLEKFAAVADTVGLSYEYATAALATVTATTRQSADVVGNAFKTLFARIQGLKLGETLDDGTDLNKYSKALDAVGISIKNTDGQLKEMDQILNELGSRWQTLAKDQQMALAQTVAGVRQYTQLIALMDSWDFFEKNVEVAKESEGTLQEQFEIYEQGWEASQKRFSAAMQNIYTQILDDDFFIDLTNALTKVVQSIGKIIESFGGLKGLLPAISTLLLKMFGSDLSAAMERFAYNIKLSTQAGRESILAERQEWANALQQIKADGTLAGDAMANVYQKQGEAQDVLINKVRDLQAHHTTLSEYEQNHISKMMEYSQLLGWIKIKETEKLETIQAETQELEEQAAVRIKAYAKKDENFNSEDFQKRLNGYKELQLAIQRAFELEEQYANIKNDQQGAENIERIVVELNKLIDITDTSIPEITKLNEAIFQLGQAKSQGPEALSIAFDNFRITLEELREVSLNDIFEKLRNSITEDCKEGQKLDEILNKLYNSFLKLGTQQTKVAVTSNNYAQSIKGIEQAITEVQNKIPSLSAKFVAMGSSLSSFAMTLQSVKSIINSWKNPDLSPWEKFLNITMSLGMLIPGVIRTWEQLNIVFNTHSGELARLQAQKTVLIAQEQAEAAAYQVTTAELMAKNAAKRLELALEKEEIALRAQATISKTMENMSMKETLDSYIAIILSREANMASMTDEQAVEAISQFLKEKNIVLWDKEKEYLIKTILARKSSMAVEEAQNTVEATNTALTEANINAKKREAAANELVDTTNKNVTKSALAANAALGITVLIIAALVAAVVIYANHLDNLAKAQKDMADQASENAKRKQEEVEENQKLMSSYEELLDKYKKGEIGKSELYDTTNKLAEAYKIEGAAVAKLTGQYDEFNEKVKAASLAQIREQKRAEKEAYEQSIPAMIADASGGRGNYDAAWLYGKPDGYVFEVPISFFATNAESESLMEAVKEATGDSTITTPLITIEDRNDPKQVIEYYETLVKLRDLLVNKYHKDPLSTEVRGINKELEQMKNYYDQAMGHAKNYNALLLQEIANQTDIVTAATVKQVNEAKTQMIQKLRKEGINLDNAEIEKAVDEYLRELNLNIVDRVLAEDELRSAGFHSEDVIKTYLGFSEQEIKVLTSFGFDINYYKTDENADRLLKDYQDYMTLNKFKDVETHVPVDLALDINETVAKGKNVNKETWEELVAVAPRAEEILGDRDAFNNKSIAERITLINELNKALIETGEEIANITKEQKKAYEEQSKILEQQIKEKQLEFDKISDKKSFNYDKYSTYQEYLDAVKNVETELDALREKQETINQIIEGADYDAAVSILANKTNRLLTDIADVQIATELIGEKWTVAAENVEQLVSLMPELINDQEELNFLEDGSLKLTKEQTALILNNNRKIIESNKEVIIDSIENKIEQLKAEKAYYIRQIELLKESLKDHTKYNENLKEMEKNTQDYANKLKELGVDVDAKSWDKMVFDSAKGAEAIQENLKQIYDRINEVHEAYKNMLTNDDYLGGFNTEGVLTTSLGDQEWRSGVSTEDIDPYWSESAAKAIEDAIKSDQEKVNEINASLADQIGILAKIKSNAKAASDAIDRVNAGKAGKEEKKTKKDKTPDKKDLIDIDKELDRYFDIKNAIAKINQELEKNEQIQKRLSTLQNHYAGKVLIASLKQENELLKQRNNILNQQYANYEKLYQLQSQELAELKGKIGGNWIGDQLQNYAELFQANVDKYNAVVAAYNAMTKEQQDASGKQMIEDAKKAYDKYKEALERYQTLYYNEMYDTENKLAEFRQQQLENHMKMIENNLKGWETEVQLKLDMTKLKREWKAFIREVEKDFRKVFEDLRVDSREDTNAFQSYVEDAETKMKQIADVEAEIRKMEASKDENGVVQLTDDMMFGSIAEAQEYLKQLQSELIDVGNSLQEIYKQVWDNYIKGLEQASKRFEDINKKAEHLGKELDFERQLIELVYGDKAYDLMEKYYETQQKYIDNQIKSVKTQAEFWEKQFNEAYELNKDKHNIDKDDMSTWTEDMKKAYDKMIESQEKLNDLVIEGIENVQKKYLNNVQKTLSDMDKQIWGMDFDKVKEDWDFIQRRADEYLDDVEGAYQIQTLANKLDKSIAESSSLKAQQKLAKLREEEIAMLREKENLTQDDIDLAEARYQIALKEIALEDAQANKTQMKLTRDTSGNWTYQYVADEEEVMTKQQELLDAYNNLYEIADNAYKHSMELSMELYEEYKQKFFELSEEIMKDTTLTEEEKMLKIRGLQDKYFPEIEAAMKNSQIYQREAIAATGAVFAEVCDEDEAAYDSLTTKQKDLVDAIRENHLEDYEDIRKAVVEDTYPDVKDAAEEAFKETNENSKTVAGQVIADWDKETKNSVKGAMKDAFKDIRKYVQDYEKELEHLEEISGKNILDPGGVVSDIEEIGEKTDEVYEDTKDAVDDMNTILDDLRRYINEVEEAWEGVIDKIKEAINTLQEYIRTMSEASSNVPGTETPSQPSQPSTPSQPAEEETGGGESGESEEKEEHTKPYSPSWPWDPMQPSKPEKAVDDGWDWYADPNGVHNTLGLTRKGELKEIIHYSGQNRDYTLLNWAKKKGYKSFFDTGGYTGDWNDNSGRLAFLHTKELVLNATDTENMLAAVNAIRDLAGLNESIEQTIANSIGRLIAGAIAPGSNTFNTSTSTSDNTSNVFNITAEFPNANDVQTIKDAILSLPNIASQYIHQR